MSGFDEPRWAVISERGTEASGVTYAEAAEQVRRLGADGVRGLCIVTVDAALRFRPLSPAIKGAK